MFSIIQMLPVSSATEKTILSAALSPTWTYNALTGELHEDGLPTIRPSGLGTQGCENKNGLDPRLEQGAEGRSEPYGQNAGWVTCGSV